MSDEYLWDRSGEPDADVAGLEELLGQFKFAPRKPASLRFAKRSRGRWWIAAAAATLVIGSLAGVLIVKRGSHGTVTSWQLSMEGNKPAAVRAGQTIETSAQHEATLQSQSVGTVSIAPESRVRVLSMRGSRQRFALDRGAIHALIWAPPTQFSVDTPWAKAVDLGCQYTLQVDDRGAGFVTVQTGWVAFEWRARESFIPAGAACKTRANSGPGTPYFLDAPAEFVSALQTFDSTADRESLATVLASARPRDALTLWHLLRRTRNREREQVFNRLSALVALPAEANRAAVLRGDQQAIDAAWNALNLGDTNWWRDWKRAW
jgi:hypothetical protein